MKTGSSNLVLVVDWEPCPGLTCCGESTEGHAFYGTLGCEPHDYAHLWGYFCIYCYKQVFYENPEELCERAIALEGAAP